MVLGLDVLRCKTPELVREGVWMGLLGYNVIRALMVEATKAHGLAPSVSFKGALQTLLAFAAGLREAGRRTNVGGYGRSSRSRSPTTRWGIAPIKWSRGGSAGPSRIPCLMVPRRQAKAALLNAT